jgi:hypothetical protein
LFTVYIPVRQKTTIRGKRIFLGIRRILAKSGTNGRLRMRRIKLPFARYVVPLTFMCGKAKERLVGVAVMLL